MDTNTFTPDQAYLIKHLGPALREGLFEVVLRKPADPIYYLARYLHKYPELNAQRSVVNSTTHLMYLFSMFFRIVGFFLSFAVACPDIIFRPDFLLNIIGVNSTIDSNLFNLLKMQKVKRIYLTTDDNVRLPFS